MVSDPFGRPEKDLKSRPETLQAFGEFARSRSISMACRVADIHIGYESTWGTHRERRNLRGSNASI